MLRKHSTYTYEHYERQHDTEHTFPLPFNPEYSTDPEQIYISANGLKAVLAFLVNDDSPEDPFDGDEGDFYQFDRGSKHYCSQPDIEDFKRIIRANPGRVFTHDGTEDCHGPGTVRCRVEAGPLTAKDTRDGYSYSISGAKNGERTASPAEQALDRAYGYYIAPEDATDPAKYARGALETYSQWCNGEVYGICVWTYERASIDEEWSEPERDECWGYFGHDEYTEEELDRCFKFAAFGNDPSQENK